MHTLGILNPVKCKCILLDLLKTFSNAFTRKNARVEPDSRHPYLIFVCLARSSADSIGDSILSTVRKAARLAVYGLIIIKVKNHHMPATILVEMALG